MSSVVLVCLCTATLAISSASKHAAVGHDADEGVPQLPGSPVGPETCRLGDLPELAPDIVLVQHRPDRRGEHEVAVLPALASSEPLLILDDLALAESDQGDLRQLQGAP